MVYSSNVRSSSRIPERKDWINISFLALTHALALLGIWWGFAHFSWKTTALALVWSGFCGIAITGGYHRLFAHPTYDASRFLRVVYLCFGAASVQNSALKWSNDHRRHHAKVDTEEDPYNIKRGFWWAHLGWVLHQEKTTELSGVSDLKRDPLVMLQHRFYVPLAIVFGALLPAALGALWGDMIGAVLIAGFLRLTLQYHATFSVNSVAHYFGKRPYDTLTSARDHFLTALITLGEGYHNFHHRFPQDYRNGVRGWQFDPTKWFVWVLSKIGVTRNLRRTPLSYIRATRLKQALMSRA